MNNSIFDSAAFSATITMILRGEEQMGKTQAELADIRKQWEWRASFDPRTAMAAAQKYLAEHAPAYSKRMEIAAIEAAHSEPIKAVYTRE